MNFQTFCNDADKDQKITAEDTFLLTYTNTRNEAFSISPDIIKSFLTFVLDNYDSILERWKLIPTRKNSFFQYEEKSYREIFKSADTEELKTISSAGRSQTKALTKLISKIIAFLSNQKYLDPEVNTLFTINDIQTALKSWDKLFSKNQTLKAHRTDTKTIKNMFHTWMLNNGLSERTATSYSVSGIGFCDKFIAHTDLNHSTLYELNSKQVLDSLEKFKGLQEWVDADKSGNGMYSASCKKLAEFLQFNSSSNTRISKPFLLLAGISGTGKTRFVREQTKASGSLNENYCLTSVRPDWHEPSDLLGYISRLSGQAEYITTDALQFIAKAWRAILDTGLSLRSQNIDAQGERLMINGDRDTLNNVLPYWLCLDEMNLAPVEQYFADYLSIMETRQWIWDDTEFTYLCDPLLKPAIIKQMPDNDKLRKSLGFDNEQYNEAWALFSEYGISIPFNLIVAGTVNMDETTHGFSRKVIDRALSYDFGEFFPNDYENFFSQNTKDKTLSYPIWSQARQKDLAITCDTNGKMTIDFLTAVNTTLNNTPFKLAYRALNELLLAVISHEPQDELTLKAIWDDFLMCKVLPRIEGDHDKLGNDPSILDNLSTLLKNQFSEFWDSEIRPDLFRANIDGTPIFIECRSKIKIKWMQDRLSLSGFTSFWP